MEQTNKNDLRDMFVVPMARHVQMIGYLVNQTKYFYPIVANSILECNNLFERTNAPKKMGVCAAKRVLFFIYIQ